MTAEGVGGARANPGPERRSAGVAGPSRNEREWLTLTDIDWKRGDTEFHFRAVAIVLHGGRVLLHRDAAQHFWSLPGGRCALMEASEQAVVREMREELGVEVVVERLVWVAEYFYPWLGASHHELAFYYMTRLPPGSALPLRERFEREVGRLHLAFQWFRLSDLATLPLYPRFLRSGLRTLPRSTRHVVCRDDEGPVGFPTRKTPTGGEGSDKTEAKG